MRALALILALLSAAPPILAAPRRSVARPAYPAFAAVDAIAERGLTSGIPGITVGIRKGNDFWLLKSYGDVRADSIFQIGSVSKQFTAAAVMRLVEQGKLSLNDKLRRYVPEFSERFDRIEIEHLLTHSSGLIEYNDYLTSAYETKTQAQMIALIGGRNPLFTAGTGALYNNSGFYLLAVIIERVSGMTYAEFLEKEFFLPLGLTQTSHCGANAGFPTPDGFIRLQNQVIPDPAADMSLLLGAGSICSSARDLIAWTDALKSGAVVQPSSFERMTQRYRLTNNVTIPYGYGLALDALNGRLRFWHNGSVRGFMSHVAHYPDSDLTIVVLTNLVDLTRDHASELADAIAGEF